MKKMIYSQRFGMIAEICDKRAMEAANLAIERGYTPMEAFTIGLKVRLDTESALNCMTDEKVMYMYERVVLNDR